MSTADPIEAANKIFEPAVAQGTPAAFRSAADEMGRLLSAWPDHWYLRYVTGQCFRLHGDIPRAVEQLRYAAEAGPDQKQVFLALGIALQLSGDLDGAIVSLGRALEIDPDYSVAFNSLALTQKKQGEYEKAIENYHRGALALARLIARDLVEERRGPFYPHPLTAGEIWVEYAMAGALATAAQDGFHRLAWPTGDEARVLDDRRDGRYVEDSTTLGAGESTRTYVPNYFNTFFQRIRSDRHFADLIGNRGTALAAAGRDEEAEQHLTEAPYYLPTPRAGDS